MRKKIEQYISRVLMVLLIGYFSALHASALFAEPEPLQSERSYAWIRSLQLPNGLVESVHDSNFVSLYENALAAILYSFRGDFDQAEKVFDYFENIREAELQMSPGGFGQFRDRNGVPLHGKPHRWLGDNAWLLIAIHNYHHMARNQKYAELVRSLDVWIRSLQKDDGRLIGGYDSNHEAIWSSTEGMLDAFNAVAGYDHFHEALLTHLSKRYWDPNKKIFLAWVEHDMYRYALDLHSWGYCAVPNAPKSILENADQFKVTKRSSLKETDISGFCFDRDLDSVWFEGTGEMVVAYQSAGMFPQAEYYLKELEKGFFQLHPDRSYVALPYVTNTGTHFAEVPLWDNVDTNPSIASSAWYLMGLWNFDPLRMGREKIIPSDHMFWR